MTGIQPHCNHNTIEIISWNCQGLKSKQAEFKKYLERGRPEIVCVQEVHQAYINHPYPIPGYHCHSSSNMANSHGDTIIMVKEDLIVHEIDSGLPETNIIKIKLKNNKYLEIINCYRSPTTEIEIDKIMEIIEKTKRNDDYLMIVGDFNAYSGYWFESKTDRRGKQIEKLIEKSNLVVLNNKQGTHIKPNGQCSIIDLILVSPEIATKMEFRVENDTLGSDHYPLVTKLGEDPEINNPPKTEKYLVKKANWTQFTNEAEEKLSKCSLTQDPETDYKNYIEILYEVCDGSIPKTRNTKRKLHPAVPYWTDRCQAAINKRKTNLKKLQKDYNNENKNNYLQAKKDVKKTIDDEKKQYWDKYCQTLTAASKLTAVWRQARKMKGSSESGSIPTLIDEKIRYESDQQKADALALKISENSKGINNSKKFKNRQKKLSVKYLDKEYVTPCTEYDCEITMDELLMAIKMAKNKSAPGLDKISYEIIKHIPCRPLNILLKILNSLWKTGKILESWKTALVKPLKKPKTKPSSMDSYRPIALTSSLCKIFERIVTNRLLHFLDEGQLLTKFQAGFRKTRSTMDQLIRLQDDAQRALNHKEVVRAIFLDMTKAFDTVWIPGLLLKLRKLKIPLYIYKFIKSFLTDRKIVVEVNGTRSKQHSLYGGTPQGSVISPLLFLIMINDFPTSEDPKIKHSLYADDSAIWAHGKNYKIITKKLQKYLDEVVKWCDKWGFALNTKKTQSITFSHKKHIDEKFKIKNKCIEETREIKFLGVVFDSRLTWRAHIDSIIEKIKPRLNLLRSLKGSNFGSNKKTLLLIYKSLIRSVLDYASPLFMGASKKQLSRLDRVQTNALSTVCGALKGTPKIALQNECGEMPLDLRRQWILKKYVCAVKMLPQNPANEVLAPDTRIGNNRRQITFNYLLDLLPITENLFKEGGKNPYPWEKDFIKIDTMLATIVNRSDESEGRVRSVEHQTRYEDRFSVYTDGSGGKKNGSGIFIPTENQKYGVRIPDFSNNYTAEAVAIQMALQYLQTAQQKKSVVYTDSLSVLTALNNNINPGSVIRHLQKILFTMKRNGHDVVLCWIPAHVGIGGNESADEAAKAAARLDSISEGVRVYPEDIHDHIMHTLTQTWQETYNSNSTAQHYKQIAPTVTTSLKYSDTENRHREIVITRMRFGVVNTNKRLHRIGRKINPNCPYCDMPETIQHLLYECTDTHLLPADVPIQRALDGGHHSHDIYDALVLLNRDQLLY